MIRTIIVHRCTKRNSIDIVRNGRDYYNMQSAISLYATTSKWYSSGQSCDILADYCLRVR